MTFSWENTYPTTDPARRRIKQTAGLRGPAIVVGHAACIVKRTPFIAAIVDLDGGGALQGTLLGVEADPAKIPFGLPVRVVYRHSGQTTAEGRPFHSYYFAPAENRT